MATQLSIYSNTLILLGERRLASLSEDRPPRHRLDTIWNANFKRRVLEAGLWNFAMRRVEVAYEPSITNEFGYTYSFTKPDDFVRTSLVCVDPDFRVGADYRDMSGYWLSYLQTLYVEYVSDDDSYGGDLAAWPESFTTYAEHELAMRACKTQTQSNTDLETLKRDRKKAKEIALSIDARANPSVKPPMSDWARARLNGGLRSQSFVAGQTS